MPFLGADERHDLRQRIEADAEPFRHPGGDRLAEGYQTQPNPYRLIAGVWAGALQCRDRGRRRREVGVPCPEIDHVHAARGQLPLLLRDRGQRILRQRAKSTSGLRRH
jgi:hypothetical protein